MKYKTITIKWDINYKEKNICNSKNKQWNHETIKLKWYDGLFEYIFKDLKHTLL